MSTTTQILFNSPALHSLKREQLVKLCKIHSIKASGKNVELIDRLKQHAQTLPKDSPLSIAARSEELSAHPQDPQSEAEDHGKQIEDDASSYQSSRPPRPSEQWEMVMDSIEEVEEDSSQSTLSSQRTINHNGHTGEFGTGSSKSSTVSSSIKALATSLGLKRSHANSKSTLSSTTSSKNTSVFPPSSIQESTADELAQMSTPYSSLPESPYLPQTDHFTFYETGNRESVGSTATTSDVDPEVLPGHALRPGVPAPPNARLSLGLGLGATPATPSRKAQPTTTIRLVGNPLPSDNNQRATTLNGSGDFGTPQLKPFKTTFDITFGSPAPVNGGFGSNMNIWPPRGDDEDVQMRGIYPTLTFDDLPPTVEVKTITPLPQDTTPSVDSDVLMPGSLMPNFANMLTTPSKSKPASNPPSPFVFGTPQHQVTDDQFRTAAAAVLEEMNAKLREDGVDEIASDIIAKLHPNAAKNKALLSPRQIKPLPGSKRGEITEKFDKMHEEEFRRMEGIDEFVRKRAERTSPMKKSPADADGEKVVVGRKRKSSVLGPDAGPKKPSVLAGRASNTRVISAGRRAKAKILPGGFDLEDDDDDASDAEAEVRGGKRPKMDPDFVPPTAEQEAQAQAAEAEEAEKKRLQMEKEREAMKKKLEANRARRRSSTLPGQGAGVLAPRKSGAGRASIARPRHSVLIKPKPKPSKFGFLSSAKSLVQSVWNRGKATTPAATAAVSNIPKAVAASSKSEAANDLDKTREPATKTGLSFMPGKRSTVAPAKSTASVATSNATAAGRSASGSKTGSLLTSSSTTSSSRSRSPLPSFNSNNTMQSNASSYAPSSKASSRMSSIAGTDRSRLSSVTNPQSGVSSIGTRLSRSSGLTNSSNASGVGSMGTKNGEGRTATTGTRSSSRFSSTTSRLLAPTASSLAKMTTRAGSGDNQASSNTTGTFTKQALGSITNSPALQSSNAKTARIRSPASSATFSPKQIFSKPLTLGQPSPSGIPVPTPLKRRGHIRGSSQSSINSNGSAEEGGKAKVAASPTTVASTAGNTGSVRTRSLNGRKPRISRSKVIARLASQRENISRNTNRVASGSSLASNTSNSTARSTLAPKVGRASAGGGKTRSSLGAKVARASYANGDKRLGVRTSSGGSHDNVLMSAKKRARRSEYARRQSQRASAAGIRKLNLGGAEGTENRMEVE